MAVHVILIIAIIFLCDGKAFNGNVKLDSNYEIWWSVKGDSITFQVEVATRGWIGFGISPNGGMAGSDVIIGWIENERATFHDRHAKGKFLPDIDNHQDWELLSYQESDTHTKLRFKRLLNTCDKDDLPINDETVKLIFAYNAENSDNVGYHGPNTRGTKSFYLMDFNVETPDNSNQDLLHWDIQLPQARVPKDSDTEYYCKFFRRPNLDRIHHITEIDTIVQPGNEKYVHHMILYECTGVKEDKIASYLEEEYTECYTKNRLPKFSFCFTVFYGWAVGGENFILPKKAGFPLGLPNSEWFLLEVHYNNPSLAEGIVDSSGFRIKYTPKRRQYDAAILSMGNLWYCSTFVPPKQKEFVIAGHSHPSCLRQRIPPEGIRVFANLLHTHIIGRKIVVRHFRDGEELPPLNRDLNYDFNYQQLRILPEERIIFPNDHLVVECTYDSTGRDRVTYAGLATTEEMCFAFSAYYPKLNLGYTASCPLPSNLVKTLGVKEMSDNDRFVISPLTGRNESYYDFLNSYPWDENSVNAVQNAIRYGPQLNICSDRESKGILTLGLSRYPKLNKTYQEPDVCAGRRK